MTLGLAVVFAGGCGSIVWWQINASGRFRQ
jgi:hypothetical protein